MSRPVVCACVCVCVCVYMFVYVYTHTHIYIYIYICVCMYENIIVNIPKYIIISHLSHFFRSFLAIYKYRQRRAVLVRTRVQVPLVLQHGHMFTF
jgi:hypothetical protein